MRSHRRRALHAALFIVCYHGTELGKAHLAQISKSNLEITVARDRKLGAARHEEGGAQGTGSGGLGAFDFRLLSRREPREGFKE